MTQIRNKNGFVFSLADLQDPEGANGLSSFAAMFQRSLYKERIYPKPPFAARPLDTWYKRNLFGRVDSRQNTIIPKTSDLVQLPNAKEPLFALNFVSDAYAKFADHMANAVMVRAVTTEGNPDLIKPTPRRAYRDPTQQYREFHAALSEHFAESFQAPVAAPIDNFQTFVKYYSAYLKGLVSLFPITKTSYVLTYGMDPLCSGLSIAIANADAADDKIKYEKFINDPNFTFYSRAAKKYGFVVDKNQPWILTADLFSPAIMVHVDNYVVGTTGDPITRDNFFDVYYTPTYRGDIENLSNMFVEAYRLLVASSPLYQIEHISDDGTFCYHTEERQKYDKEGLLAELDPQFLIDLYIDLRQLESRNGYTPDQVARLKRMVYNLYTLKMPDSPLTPFQRVAREVNYRYRKFIYPENISQLTGVSPRKSKTSGAHRSPNKAFKK